MIYRVKIPVHVCLADNTPADEAARFICAEIEAEDADEAAAAFVLRLFGDLIGDDEDNAPPTVFS